LEALRVNVITRWPMSYPLWHYICIIIDWFDAVCWITGRVSGVACKKPMPLVWKRSVLEQVTLRLFK